MLALEEKLKAKHASVLSSLEVSIRDTVGALADVEKQKALADLNIAMTAAQEAAVEEVRKEQGRLREVLVKEKDAAQALLLTQKEAELASALSTKDSETLSQLSTAKEANDVAVKVLKDEHEGVCMKLKEEHEGVCKAFHEKVDTLQADLVSVEDR